MTFAFAPPQQASVPIAGSDLLFPVHRIYCVGRNYNDHVKEMGGVVGRDPPFFFANTAVAMLSGSGRGVSNRPSNGMITIKNPK